MKFNKLFLGAALLSMGVFTSCSNDDEPANNGGQGNADGSNYIAVRIQTAGMSGSRAAGEGFEEGTTDEGKVTEANTRFYFFNLDGSAFKMEAISGTVNGTVTPESGKSSNMVKPSSVTPGKTDGNETAGTAVLVLGKPDGTAHVGTVPARALCVVGLSDSEFKALENLSLAELANVSRNYESTNDFVMSNSNYKGANDLGATNIADKVAPTISEANAKPADFWIERLAVKVRMDEKKGLRSLVSMKTDGVTPEEYTIYKSDGSTEKVQLKVDLKNWQLVKKSDKAYLFKKLPTVEPNWTWNNADYHRCYWAAPTIGATLSATPGFDIYEETGWLGTGVADYTNEYTDGDALKLNDRTSTTTAIAIRGYVQIGNDESGWKNIDLVKWAGAYYELTTFKQMVVNAYNFEKNQSIGQDDVKMVLDGTTNTYKVQINNADFAPYSNILYWVDGVTSYYLNIKHESVKEGNEVKNVYGVVRNHIYNFEITNVVGLGIPGNYESTPEETETFVSARLNVLNWKVVSNSVTLE